LALAIGVIYGVGSLLGEGAVRVVLQIVINEMLSRHVPYALFGPVFTGIIYIVTKLLNGVPLL